MQILSEIRFTELQWNSILKLHWGESKITKWLTRGPNWDISVRKILKKKKKNGTEYTGATIPLSQSRSHNLHSDTKLYIRILKCFLDSLRRCLKMTRKWEKPSWIPTWPAAGRTDYLETYNLAHSIRGTLCLNLCAKFTPGTQQLVQLSDALLLIHILPTGRQEVLISSAR